MGTCLTRNGYIYANSSCRHKRQLLQHFAVGIPGKHHRAFGVAVAAKASIVAEGTTSSVTCYWPHYIMMRPPTGAFALRYEQDALRSCDKASSNMQPLDNEG